MVRRSLLPPEGKPTARCPWRRCGNHSATSPEGGFTLIELMVVLLIIAILLAIAIPTFLGVTGSANDRAVQSNLSNGLTEAMTRYEDAGQTFSNVSSTLSSSAPEYTWTGSTMVCSTSQPNCISIYPADTAIAGDNQVLVMSAMSKTGTCWWVAQVESAPKAVPGSGFITLAYSSTHAAGMEYITSGGTTANISTAGTYYARKVNPGTNCDAKYAETDSSGFQWGPSFGNAGRD
ncbi:MAG: prepilin-type N-terminal cleavage/methylation domain-containing protein [Acidimicrobiales bacterium]